MQKSGRKPAVVSDITKRKDAEERDKQHAEDMAVLSHTAMEFVELSPDKDIFQLVREERNRIQQYLDLAGVMFVAIDREGIVKLINKRGCNILGYKEEEIVGKNWFDNFVPKHIQPIVQPVSQKLFDGKKDEVEYFENPVLTKDGREPVIAWHRTILRGDDGSIIGHLSSGEDITDRKEAERALLESEERFRQFFENAPEYCYMISPEGVILNANRAALTTLGYNKDEIVGKKLEIIYPPESLPKMKQLFQQWKEKGEIKDQEIYMITKAGEKRTVLLSASTVMDNSGNVLHSISIQKDITDRKRAEGEKAKLQDQLQQAQKMEAIGQLAGGIAHDFNNLLGGISGYADILKIKIEQDSPLVKYVQKIQDAAMKAAGLTHQLLTFARKARVEMGSVDIHKAIDQMLGIFERTVDRRIEIKRHLDAHITTVVGDAGLIENALLNLAINARDAMPEGGRLTLATEVTYLKKSWFRAQPFDGTPGIYLKVSVADTGIGMDKTTQDRVFEPFFTTKEPGKGTGLGLASVYGCVKQHNGYITVQGEPGKGSQFTLFLPLAKKLEEEVNNKSEIIHGKGTVLIVDDEIIMREAAAEMLTQMGYKVTLCTNGIEAVEYFKKNYKETDAVLLDMMMPKMNGIDCCRKLKEINPQVRVIIASGYSDEKQDMQIKELGITNFLEKPFKIYKLSRCIADVLAKRS